MAFPSGGGPCATIALICGLDVSPCAYIYCLTIFPRGCHGFDGGSEMAWCMPRGQLSSLIQPQTYSCQRRQLRSGRLRPSPEPTCARARGCRVIITRSPEAAACRQGLNQAGWSFDALCTLCCRGTRSNGELSM